MKAKPSNHRGEVVLELGPRDEALMATAFDSKPSSFSVKRILVPIDFSDCARKALQYAIPLAREHDASITAIYVIPPIYGVGEYGGIEYMPLESEARAYGEQRLAAMVLDEVDGTVTVNTLVRSGSPAGQIIRVAQDLPADLIVISTHGRTGLKHALVGSVAEHLVRGAPCPVLVVREKEHEFLV